MPGLRTLLLILTAMVFALGGAARAPPMQAGPGPMAPPCHEMPAHHGDGSQAPAKAMMSANCCAGCMPAAQALDLPVDLPHAMATPVFETAAVALSGRDVAPDPRPPRA